MFGVKFAKGWFTINTIITEYVVLPIGSLHHDAVSPHCDHTDVDLSAGSPLERINAHHVLANVPRRSNMLPYHYWAP